MTVRAERAVGTEPGAVLDLPGIVGLGGTRGRNRASAHYRHTPRTPGPKGIGLLASFLVVALLILASDLLVGSARASGPQVCTCACYGTCGGSSCPSGPLTLSASVATNDPTNATVVVLVTSSGDLAAAYINLTWGNSTSYPYRAITDEYTSGTVSGSSDLGVSVFIDYLKPSTTYYYEATGWISCRDTSTHLYHASVTGSWTAGSDQLSSFVGRVTDSTGSIFATGNLYVEASCFGLSSGYVNDPSWTLTSSSGTFGGLAVPGYYVSTGVPESTCPSGPFVIQLVNSPTEYVTSGLNTYTSNQWDGHWNESLVVWAVQFVTFDLAISPVSTLPIVTVAEFSHTGYASVGYCETTSSSVETQDQYTASGSVYGATFTVNSQISRTTSFGSSSCIDTQGEPGFEAWGYPYVGGEIAYDAIGNRTPWIAWTQFYGPLQDPGDGNVTSAPVQDWGTEPTEATQACYSSEYGSYIYGFYVAPNTSPQTFTFSAGGSVSGASGEQFGVSIPVQIDGVSVGTLGGQWGYTLTTDESNDFSATITAGGPYASAEYYTISGCTASNTGIVLHVWSSSSPL